MKNIKFDLFKTSIIILLGGFLMVFHQYSQNGKFVKGISDEWPVIINSRTGEVYTINEKGTIIQINKKIVKKNLNE